MYCRFLSKIFLGEDISERDLNSRKKGSKRKPRERDSLTSFLISFDIFVEQSQYCKLSKIIHILRHALSRPLYSDIKLSDIRLFTRKYKKRTRSSFHDKSLLAHTLRLPTRSSPSLHDTQSNIQSYIACFYSKLARSLNPISVAPVTVAPVFVSDSRNRVISLQESDLLSYQ